MLVDRVRMAQATFVPNKAFSSDRASRAEIAPVVHARCHSTWSVTKVHIYAGSFVRRQHPALANSPPAVTRTFADGSVAWLSLALPKGQQQADLFAPSSAQSDALVAVMDQIKAKGLGRVGFASQGTGSAEWMMRQEHLSPCYTNRREDLPVAR